MFPQMSASTRRFKLEEICASFGTKPYLKPPAHYAGIWAGFLYPRKCTGVLTRSEIAVLLSFIHVHSSLHVTPNTMCTYAPHVYGKARVQLYVWEVPLQKVSHGLVCVKLFPPKTTNKGVSTRVQQGARGSPCLLQSISLTVAVPLLGQP
jgi:hypothetical protein